MILKRVTACIQTRMDRQTLPEILAVAVADRYDHVDSSSFKDNPIKIRYIVENNPLFTLDLSYRHSRDSSLLQTYRYTVNIDRLEGTFVSMENILNK